MEEDIIKDPDEDLDLKIPHDIEKTGEISDEDTESVEELANEEEEVEEPFDDVDLL